MNTSSKIIPALLLVALAAPTALASVHDHIYANGFDIPADAPASKAEASRFLTQATFGPNQTDITRLMAVGYNEWIEEQLGMRATLGEPTVEAVVNARIAGAQNTGQTQRLNRWFWQATYAPDQLRQRMAYALSQIFVVSDQSSMINGDVVPMTAYGDLLATDAFGIYRTLLSDVTYNPTMGKYLNAFRNLKPSATTSPDENYAREVMQLFSVGLIKLNKDHSPLLVGGLTVPTYDQNVITHTAKVFTGLTYSDAPIGTGANFSGANFYGGSLTFAGQYNPMQCWGTELFPYSNGNMRHDITGDDGTLHTDKTVLGGAIIPSGQDCDLDLGDEMDIIAAHPNIAPFISSQLIQRFVTSNPSPAYIQRVATVFDNSTGDLGDVLKAILTDSEARNPPAAGTLSETDSYGKLREPILRLTAMWRAFNAVAPAADIYGEIGMTGNTGFLTAYGQGPLESPTVFNFYTPDYQQPGVFSTNNLNSPELQILNESTLYSSINSYYNFTANSYVGISPLPTTPRPMIDLTTLTANVGTPALMVATINANMLYGTMSSSMQSALSNMIQFGLNGATANEKAWSLIYVTMLSPEYAAQR